MEPNQNKPVFGPIFVDLNEPGPPGTSSPSVSATAPFPPKPPKPRDDPRIKVQASLKGIENAKKRLRAFSIQKKHPSMPGTATSAATSLPKAVPFPPVIIAKNIVKPLPAKPSVKPIPYEVEDKKVAVPIIKPPKPGTSDSYSELKKKTLTEIEDMKRKIELVELGIPLGLICPASNSPASKAMPTKAMPPIKSFLAPEKLDEIICEAKKAKAEGREFKFDYSKLLPQYDNPFQRKNFGKEKKEDKSQEKDDRSSSKDYKYDKSKSDRDRRRSVSRFDKYDSRKHSSYRKDDRDRKYKERDERSKDNKERDAKSKERESKTKEVDTAILGKEKAVEEEPSNEKSDKPVNETDVNLNDYLVCDSWSLDNDDKTDTSSPKVVEVKKNISSPKVVDVKKNISSPKVVEVKKTDGEEKKEIKLENVFKDPMDQLRESILKKKLLIDKNVLEIEQGEIYMSKPVIDDIPLPVAPPVSEIPLPKIEKLKPVVDSFTYEIEPDDDIFYEDIMIDNFCQPTKHKSYDQDSQDASKDEDNNEDFLESVINEIKQENMSDDMSQDKGLVEYDMSPDKNEDYFGTPEKSLQNSRSSVTPELDDKMIANVSVRSSESGIKSTESGYKSTESCYKSTESGYKSTESGYKSTESVKSRDKSVESSVTPAIFRESEESVVRATEDSLETWSFVMKICQPLLFRHDRNKCYRETKQTPKLWYTENPKLCDCVQDRTVVYEELETCKMNIVDKLYQCSQLPEAASLKVRDWYLKDTAWLTESKTINLSNEWESEDSANNEQKDESLDTEYQRFMESVWPDVVESKKETGSATPTKEKKRKKKMEGDGKKGKKMKLNSWSQESEVEEVEKSKKSKMESKKEKRKRKRAASSDSDSSDDDHRKSKKKSNKKKEIKKAKKSAKRRRMEKKYLKKLKEKQKSKSKKAKEKAEKMEIVSEKEEEKEKEKPKKQSKAKKKSQSKSKKKESKKRKKEKSSSSSSSDSDSDTDSSRERRLRKKKKDRKRKSGPSCEPRQEELFDVNVLNNIKTEKGTDDEVTNKKKTEEMQDFSPRRQPHRPRQEIINMNQLQSDFVTKNMNIKQESSESPKVQETSQVSTKDSPVSNTEDSVSSKEVVKDGAVAKNSFVVANKDKESRANEFDEESKGDDKLTPEKPQQTSKSSSETSQSQDSSQDSNGSLKQSYEKVTSYEKELTSYERDIERYEKDTSHLRPSSQNSNYSFNDVISASHGHVYQKDMGEVVGNYEMYEQMAMEYMSGAANQELSQSPQTEGNQKIETVVSTMGSRGEIKYDWRPGLPLTRAPSRPSRWGLKPGEANIVLTGQSSQEHTYPIRSVLDDNKTYQIQSITDSGSVYDEAYADMYGASDRLQYGDCFSQSEHRMGQQFGQRFDQRLDQHTEDMTSSEDVDRRSSLDKRIDRVLGKSEEVVKEEAESQDRGILITKTPLVSTKGGKRVSFADGYKPGQDSDDEAPPPKKKRGVRYGAAWPVPASHPDHVPLWDALPPPPPPPGSPPPVHRAPPPIHLLRMGRQEQGNPGLMQMPRFDACPPGLLAEPPPTLLPLPRALL